MSRLIDGDALKELFPDDGEGSWTYNVTAKAYIDAQPTIEPEHDDEVTFWKKRANEYEAKICEFMTKIVKGMAVDSIVINKDGIVFKKSQPEIIRCKDCKHKPYPSDNYDYGNGNCGFEIIFPDYRCPCRCDDEYYNRIPDDDWFCGNAERRIDE